MQASMFSKVRPFLYAINLLIGSCLYASAAYAAPTIGQVTPANAVANVPVTLSVTANTSLQSCRLYVDLADVGAMNINGNSASMSYTFTSGGSRIAFAFCRDQSGSAASGPYTSMWVEGSLAPSDSFAGAPPATNSIANPISTPTPTPVVTTPAPTTVQPTPIAAPITVTNPFTGKLIKLECQANALPDDPCKAVYYVGIDGKRHAFPNANAYFTWYANFDDVQLVSAADLSQFPIGKNVTYRPGTRLVKFTSVNNVYAVSKVEGLRWITSEDLAKTLFGTDWNTKIDDIDDSLYGNYKFGSAITSSNDYSIANELQATMSIDTVL